MEDASEQHHFATFESIPMGWPEQQTYPHSHHGTPAQEYPGFGWGSPPLPMHQATFAQSPPLRPSHHQLQPLMMPSWPSMLGSQQAFYPTLVPQSQIGTTSPPTVTPLSAGSARSGPSVRKTLSDDDRRRMCKYAEENPGTKQTEIGFLFGVERSTVSKVLRKKDIYMGKIKPKETPRSPPTKRSKVRLPDIEKTLSVWATKEQRKGASITDDAIREQAYYFASVPGPENSASNPVNNPGWLEKFKQKHHINIKGGVIKPQPKDSVADPENGHGRHSPSTAGISPTSPSDEMASSSSPDMKFPTMDSTMTNDNNNNNKDIKPSTLTSTRRRKSPPSLNTAFTDLGLASTCFTPSNNNILSPTSPFFSPDSQVSQPLHSPLSVQNFSALDHFMASSASSSPIHSPPAVPSYVHNDDDDNHDDDTTTSGKLDMIDESMEDVKVLDLKVEQQGASKEEAREALSVVLAFFEGQASGCLEAQEWLLLGRLVEKLKGVE